jgi:hypothetical protein
MSEPVLEIRDVSILNALNRALLEAKFHLEPNDALVAGSPLVADLANQVADALERLAATELRNPRRDPGAWRDPAAHPEKLLAVRARLRECEP